MDVVRVIAGVTALALSMLMLRVGSPRNGVSPAFMRNAAMEMLYPVAWLIALVVGVAGILSGLPWSFL